MSITIDNRREAVDRMRLLVPHFAETIHPFYKQLDWVWGDISVPTIHDLEATLYQLLDDLNIRETEWWIETGGLRVEFEQHKDGSVSSDMQMIISVYSCRRSGGK